MRELRQAGDVVDLDCPPFFIDRVEDAVRLAQLLVLPDGHDDRYYLAAMMNDIVGVTGGHLTHEDHGNEADPTV
jgi:hypothetical protein